MPLMQAALDRDFKEADLGPVPVAVSAADLIEIAFPPLEPILEPWLFQKNLVMVHSWRGIGKTQFALSLAWAITLGASFLGWKAPKPRAVLYLDGEMSVQLMKQRCAALASQYGEMPKKLDIVTPDLQDRALPDLGTVRGQMVIDRLVEYLGSELIIVDNLSALVRSGGAENDAESWDCVSQWALAHRRANRTILFVHHSGKSGRQRGTSKREDLLDVVLQLRRPPDYKDVDGAVFEIHFEKGRSLVGEDLAPLEAKLEQMPDGGSVWTYRLVDTVQTAQIQALWNAGGVSITDIARELGKHKSNIHRHLKAAMDAGQLTRPYPAVARNKT